MLQVGTKTDLERNDKLAQIRGRIKLIASAAKGASDDDDTSSGEIILAALTDVERELEGLTTAKEPRP